MLWMLMKLEKDIINLKVSWRHGGANVWQSQSLWCKRLRWLKFCLVSSLDIWYFLCCWCLRTKWCDFLSTCKAYQSFSPSPSSNPANPPTGMIFFSPWRRTFRPRAFLKSLQVPINGTVALPEGSEKFTGEWYFMIFFGKMVKHLSFWR